MEQKSNFQPVKSAERALKILEFIGKTKSVGFLDVLELGYPRSSTHQLLHTLEKEGWIYLNPDNRKYSLAIKTWELGQAYDAHQNIIDCTAPILDKLLQQTRETVQLAQLDGIMNLYIAIRESPQPIRMASKVGMRLYSHGTGIGKALLSTLSEKECRSRLNDVVLPKMTDSTITDVDDLIKAINKVRDLGYAIDDEEFVKDCRCIAIPLASEKETGVPIALSITMPASRTDENWVYKLLPLLIEAKEEARRNLALI